MKKSIKESQLNKIIYESIKKALKEGESYGWIVEPQDADVAYDFGVEQLGEEELNKAIVRSLGSRALSDCLAYIFRMYDLDEWEAYLENNRNSQF